MRIDIKYAIWPRDLDWVKACRMIHTFATDRNFITGDRATSFIMYVDRNETHVADDLAEFEKLYNSVPAFDRISTTQLFAKPKGGPTLMVEIVRDRNIVEVSIGCEPDVVQLLHSKVSQEFRLQKAPIPAVDNSRAFFPQPTVFLGRHFDEYAAKLSVTLIKFLSLLGIRVTEGEAYSARDIPDKVKAAINENDIYIGLVTPNPEHDWLHAELGLAQGRDRHVLIVLEKGITFNPTLKGRDFEQIRFAPNEIEQAFIPLLTEFRNIGMRL